MELIAVSITWRLISLSEFKVLCPTMIGATDKDDMEMIYFLKI